MVRAYETLLKLYPDDTRFAYGREFLLEFERGCAAARQHGRLSLLRFVAGQWLTMLCDAIVDRIHTLYSHRTFHGPSRPDPGLVRPPNMGKREWFDATRE